MSARKTTRRSSKSTRAKSVARVPMGGWTCLEDDVDERWVRRAADGSYYFVCVTDMWEATGEEDQARYLADLLRVVLDEVPEDARRSAIVESCGGDPASDVFRSDEVVAECVRNYGIYQPLGQFSGGDSASLREQARRTAEKYMGDADALDERLERPVNQIGTTAREFGRGEVTAGLHRRIKSVDEEYEPGDEDDEAESDEPWFPEGEADVRSPFLIPSFPGTEHPGFRYVRNLFVDSLGFGRESELAMTQRAFVEWVRRAIRDGEQYGYGITDAGPFQVNVGVYVRDGDAARGERAGAGGGTARDRARLRKFKNLTTERGASPGEAAAARARADELEAKLRASKPRRGKQPKRRRVVPAVVPFPGHFSTAGGVPSVDPIAYAMGFKDGWSMSSEPARRYFDDKADAYVEGFKVGRRVRAGLEPVPAWVQ